MSEKLEIRDAAREAALREIKERIKKTKDEKKLKKEKVSAKQQKTQGKGNIPKGSANFVTRPVELAEARGSGIVSRRLTRHAESENFEMKIPNNKVVKQLKICKLELEFVFSFVYYYKLGGGGGKR
ncbi:hypothetical protein CRYUN_Cryun14cG0044900 [Craigia yunnanensis]